MDKVATNIDTNKWNEILGNLRRHDWALVLQYDGFDKGIDYDFYVLEKDKVQILFGWTNWFEGEIKCSSQQLECLERYFAVTFCYEQPEILSEDSIAHFKKISIKPRFSTLLYEKFLQILPNNR